MPALDAFFTVAWLAFWVYWLVAASGAKRSRPGQRTFGLAGPRVAIVIVVLVVLRTPLFRGHSLTVHSPVLQAIGVVLFVAGLGFAVWARVHLGANWGIPMSQRLEPDLVTSGPYRFVRNPIYTGVLAAFAGTALAVTLYWLIALAIIGPYFAYSAIVEERSMEEAFPGQYPAYRSRTKRFIPFVW